MKRILILFSASCLIAGSLFAQAIDPVKAYQAIPAPTFQGPPLAIGKSYIYTTPFKSTFTILQLRQPIQNLPSNPAEEQKIRDGLAGYTFRTVNDAKITEEQKAGTYTYTIIIPDNIELRYTMNIFMLDVAANGTKRLVEFFQMSSLDQSATANAPSQQPASAAPLPSTPATRTYPFGALQAWSGTNPLSLSDMVGKPVNPAGFSLKLSTYTLIDKPSSVEITGIPPSSIEMRGVQVFLLQDKYPKNPNALNQPAIGLDDRLDLLSGTTKLNGYVEGSAYAIANTIYPSVRMFFMNPSSQSYIRAATSNGSINLPSSSGHQIVAFFSTNITQAMAFDVSEQASVKAFAPPVST